MPKPYPTHEELFNTLRMTPKPLTTIEVHMLTRERVGLPAPHHHGTAATMTRLQRLYDEGKINYRLNEHGARVWFVRER